MSNVFVLDLNKQPLNPVHPGRARILLSSGKAAVYRRFPFTIILKVAVEEPNVDPLRIKIDPGANTTGIAIVNTASGEVVFAASLKHRGFAISASLTRRRSVRRGRRQRRTRYRKPRFTNRLTNTKGWLPPSVQSRIANVMTWVGRLRRVCPLAAISMELVKFDTQLMEHAEISGVEYQQGTLQGYEVREYLLEKWGRKCAYCDAKGVSLQIEHVYPRSKYGDSRVGRLTIACELCNDKKGTQEITEFLKNDPERLAHILAQMKCPLKDAAAVNATRWLLYDRLKAQGLPIETGSGGLTKYNRTTRNLPKEHWIDAACVGMSTPAWLAVNGVLPLRITATGHGCRQLCLMDTFGFPRTKPKQAKRVKGYQTGDIVRAVVAKGKKIGTYVGKVAVRSSGSFNITTTHGVVQGISHRSCTPIHRSDGYRYEKGAAAFPPVA
ncbi:MAG: RNA-guided endonuclease IscB [Ktedonobacteraceae bacterium]